MTDDMSDDMLSTNPPYSLEGDTEPIEEIITALIDGVPIFRARGNARIKVGGRTIQVPIRSVDMIEAIKLLDYKRPVPPTDRVFIRQDEAKKNGTRSGWTTVVKEADQGYQAALRAYNTELNEVIMLKGLAIPVHDGGGKIVWDPNDQNKQDIEASLAVLRRQGMTGHQFQNVIEAIQDLTRFEEEELEKNSDGD